MCGIAGYLRAEDSPLEQGLLRPMCERIVHRGPDGYGEYFSTDVALGHRRLSIVDVEGGAQPLPNEDGSVQVVFNGEIYNHRELRKLLLDRGHNLHTACDTEVLVHLYEEYGERVPELLNGMFAFAIWDQPRKRLFLARDRFGEKPLYYSTVLPGLRIAFASELKALTLLPGVDRAIRPRAIPEFLCHGYIADPATIYQQFERLAPGSSLTIDWSTITHRTYWKPAFEVEEGRRYSASTARVAELAAHAVESRLMSDVPLGAFLSGGLDSSAVVASMAQPGVRHGGERIRSFSIGFDDETFDETYYARLVAERHHTAHNELIVHANLPDTLDLCLEHFDEPFGDSSAIPTLALARFARQDVTVALSGDGADEVFGGYARYGNVIAAALKALLPPRFARFGKEFAWSYDNLPELFGSDSVVEQLNRSVVEHYFHWTSATDEERLFQMLAPDLKAQLEGYTPAGALADRFAKHRTLPLLHQMQAVDMETYLPGDILVKIDRASMAFSLESRAPWLDHRLTEYAGTLPQGFKMKRGIGKRILRSAFAPLLPEATLKRPKMGFGPPLAGWLRTSLKPVFEEYVFRPAMAEYLSLPAVEELWEEHQSGANDYRIWVLWNILMLARWDARYRAGGVDRIFRDVVANSEQQIPPLHYGMEKVTVDTTTMKAL